MPKNTRASKTRQPVAVLEVRQLWGDVVIDTKHFRPSVGAVRVGDRLGWRWDLLGVDMGFVPEPLHKILPWLPPVWSDVSTAPVDDFATESQALDGAAEHTLFSFDEELGWQLHPPRGEQVAVAEGVELQLGDTRFEARVVDPASRVNRAAWAMDAPFAGTSGMMAGLGLCFGVLVATAPAPPEVSVSELPQDAFVAMLKAPPKAPEKKKPEPVVDAKKPAPEKASRGAGSKKAPLKRGGGKGLKRDRDVEKVRTSGIFSNGGLDELLGTTGLSSTLVSAAGTLAAKGFGGSDIGVSGLGDRAGGLGDGGGDAEGLGGLDPWGDGGPPGAGHDGFGDKSDGDGISTGGTPLLIGNIDASLVDRVVRNHLSQIRYCYQRELTKDPALQGKISVKFTIASDGTVSAAHAKTNTLANDSVGQCVVGKFLRMQFPELQGGGIALVTYPFVFAPG